MFTDTPSNDSGLFRIPEDFTQKVPCQQSPQLFDDVALEIDLEENEWLALKGTEQNAYIQAKREAEERAIVACNRCPLLEACKDWALSTEVEIFGVVGGTTPEQRSPQLKTSHIAADPTTSKQSKSDRDAIIHEMLAAGVSNKDIAKQVRCSIRTVERRKAALRNPAIPVHDQATTPSVNNADAILRSGKVTRLQRSATTEEASNTLTPSRVTPETAAIFDELVDGSVRSREALLELAPALVSKEQALSTLAEDRVYETEEEAYSAGARKFLMNRIDIAARRGRLILMQTETKDILVSMDPETASVWSSYRAKIAS